MRVHRSPVGIGIVAVVVVTSASILLPACASNARTVSRVGRPGTAGSAAAGTANGDPTDRGRTTGNGRLNGGLSGGLSGGAIGSAGVQVVGNEMDKADANSRDPDAR